MKSIKPYVLPRPFGGFNIPIPLQTSYIKQYAEQNNYKFILPVAELARANSYHIIKDFLRSNNKFEIGVVSIFVFPIENKALMNSIFKSYRKKRIKIHAILESKIFSTNEILPWSEEISELRSLSLKYDSKVLKQLKLS